MTSPILRKVIADLSAKWHSFDNRSLFQVFQPFRNKAVMSWGIRKRIVIADKLCIMKVNGLLHKGYVIISYNGGTDLFNVHIVSTRGNMKVEHHDIYLEDLVDVIDGEVERKNNWNDESYRENLESLGNNWW